MSDLTSELGMCRRWAGYLMGGGSSFISEAF